MVGGICGAFLFSILVKSFGRRTNILLFDLLGIISCICNLIINKYFFLMTGFIKGIVFGANLAIIPVYASEFSNNEVYDLIAMFMGIQFPIGLEIAFLVGLNVK